MLGVDYYPNAIDVDGLTHVYLWANQVDLDYIGSNYPSESFTSLCFWLGEDGYNG